MRKTTLAIAAVAAVAGVAAASAASAQSSVTVFGSIDLNLTYSKAGGQSVKGMDQGGYMLPSRWGIRGTEDLGNGLYAGFWLESAVLPDTGGAQAAFWGRRSTVSLGSKEYGELRLGRDYTPTFWNISQFAPFGTVGVGGSSNIIEGYPLGLGNAKTQARASNSIGYFLPRRFGGLYGQLMVAAGEGADGASFRGGRFGYEAGSLNTAAAYGVTKTAVGDFKSTGVGGTYDFGVFKTYLNYLRNTLGSDKQTTVLIGASVPVGVGQVKASFARSDRSGPGVDADDARQVAVGYSYPLSKRTTLYSTYSYIRNEGNAAYVTSDSSANGVPGQRSTGLQVGMRHDF